MANGDNEKLEQTLRELINTLKDTSKKNRESVESAQKNAEEATKGFLDRAKSFDEDLKKLNESLSESEQTVQSIGKTRKQIKKSLQEELQFIKDQKKQQEIAAKNQKTVIEALKKEYDRINRRLESNNDLTEEQIELEKQKLKLLEEQAKQYDVNLSKMDKFKAVGKKVLEVGKNLKAAGSAAFDFGKELSRAASDAANKFGGLEKGVLSFDTAVSQTKAINQFSIDLQRTSGLSGDLTNAIIDTQEELRGFGITNEQVSETFQNLGKGMSDFTRMDRTTRDELVKTVAKFKTVGVGIEDTTKLLEVGTKTLGMSQEQSIALQEELVKTAKGIGVAPAQMVQGFATAAPKLSAHGASINKVFEGLALQSKNTGTSIEGLLGIAEGFDTFESAAQKTSQLNAMFGTQLNSVELLNATEEERIKILQDSLTATGKSVDQMSRFELKSLAQIIGVDVGTVRQTFGAAQDGLADLEKKASDAKSEVDLSKEMEKTVSIQEKLKSGNEAFKNTTVEEMIPALNKQADSLARNDKLMTNMKNSGQTLAKAYGASVKATANLADNLDKVAAAEGAFGWMDDILSIIGDISSAFMAFGGRLNELFNIGDKVKAVFDKIGNSKFVQGVFKMGGKVTDFVGKGVQGIKNFGGRVATGAKNIATKALPKIPGGATLGRLLGKAGGKLLGPMAQVLIGGVQAGSVLTNNKLSKLEKAQKLLPIGAGTLGGILGGALGGTIGSVVPGFGTFIGMVGGSVAGQWLGDMIGSSKTVQDALAPFLADYMPGEDKPSAVTPTTTQAAVDSVESPATSMSVPTVTPQADMANAQTSTITRAVQTTVNSAQTRQNSKQPVFNIYAQIGNKRVLADVVKVGIDDAFGSPGSVGTV